MVETLPKWLAETDDEPLAPPPWWVRAGRTLFAIIALASILYLSGIHQYFFYHRTPDSAEPPIIASKITTEELIIPVTVHILTGTPGSERREDDALRLIANANRIWHQANITFALQTVAYHPITSDDRRAFERDPHTFITQSETYDPTAANLYLTRTLNGINGLAYGGTNAIAVADFTSTLDYRTLAHEFGHLLGLPHVPNTEQLMSSGATGTDLSLEEIATARVSAKSLLTIVYRL